MAEAIFVEGIFLVARHNAMRFDADLADRKLVAAHAERTFRERRRYIIQRVGFIRRTIRLAIRRMNSGSIIHRAN